jgi:hypothetical protein
MSNVPSPGHIETKCRRGPRGYWLYNSMAVPFLDAVL